MTALQVGGCRFSPQYGELVLAALLHGAQLYESRVKNQGPVVQNLTKLLAKVMLKFLS